MIFGMLAVIAEFEFDLISERTKIGLQVARSKGKTLGRPETAIDAERLTGMRARGFSKRRMARELNVPLTTLRRRIAS
jgi:putative DNA-invertase from lambdoid prophage Rac